MKGNRAKNFIDLTGDRYGSLTVIKYHGKNNNGRTMWECKCDCGNTAITSSNLLRRGHTRSCRCLYKGTRGLNKTHNLSKSRFYNIWCKMKSKCINKNKESWSHKHYASKGVIVCDRWQNFDNFKEDMYEKYVSHVDEFGEKNTTIDRIDVNGNYELSNCRWATWSEQATNKRDTIYFKFINEDTDEIYYGNNFTIFSKYIGCDNSHASKCLKNNKKIKGVWAGYIIDREEYLESKNGK